ncbi:MAG: phosphatase PAP2 family protein [Candidatus Rokubacteria bacterium]|nr:phosphatase PAP2 family protein [Candidatus Rokubacteria bacterium]
MVTPVHPRAVLLVSSACFVLLALAVVVAGTPPGDGSTRDALLASASPPVLAAMRVINDAGSWKLLLPATLLLVLVYRRAREHWWVWLGLMIAAPATEGLLKLVIGRQRPEDASMSFPSGHATAAAAFFGALIYLAEPLPPLVRRCVRAAAVAVIVLVATARVILRAHWPSDALAGIALGLAFASVAALLARRSRVTQGP